MSPHIDPYDHGEGGSNVPRFWGHQERHVHHHGDDSDDDTSAEDGYTELVTEVKRDVGTVGQNTTTVVTRHPDPEKAADRHERAVEKARVLIEYGLDEVSP